MCVLNTKMVTPLLTFQWEGMLISDVSAPARSPKVPPTPCLPVKGRVILCTPSLRSRRREASPSPALACPVGHFVLGRTKVRCVLGPAGVG